MNANIVMVPTTTHAIQDPDLRSQHDFVGRQSRIVMFEILAMVSMTLVATACYLAGAERMVGYVVPLTIIIVGALANFAMIKQDSNAVLTPLFGMRMIAMFMFGGGSLFHNFVPPEIQTGFDAMFVTTARDEARVNLLWLTGFDLLLMGSLVGLRLSMRWRIRQTKKVELKFNVGLILFAIGFLATAMQSFVLDLSLPGAVKNLLLALELSGLFIVGRQFRGSGLEYFWTFLISLMLIALTIFAMVKGLMFYPMIALLLGLISARTTLLRCFFAAATITFLFGFVAPIVSYSREASVRLGTEVEGPDFSRRLDVIKGYWSENNTPVQDGATASRLDYVVPTAFVMNQNDIGVPSKNILNSGFMLVPRILWPDKPETTSQGEVNYLMGFQFMNMIGVTIFGDIYWNFGYLGLGLLSFVGVYFGAMTLLNRELMRREDWIMLPFILSVFNLSLQLDNEFMTAIVIPMVLNTAIFILLRLISTLASSNRFSRPASQR